MKPNALQKIVLQEFPNSKVIPTTDTGTNPVRDLGRGVRRAVSLRQLKSHILAQPTATADTASAKTTSRPARKSSARKSQAKGPSGVVTIMPSNADGTARRQAKTVIVSRGKVIALQG